MKRYQLTSLGIGLLVAVVVLALYFLKVFDPLSIWLAELLQSLGVFPAAKQVERLDQAEWLAVPVIALWSCWALSTLSQFSQKLIVTFIFALIILAITPTLALYGKLFDPFAAVSALLLGAGGAFGLAATEIGKRKRTLETVLGGRVSQQMFDELLLDKRPLSFEGQKSDVTLLTCRLLNRAELMEQLSPGDFLRITNLFRQAVSNFLASKGGYLDEAGPDLVRVYFGLLRPGENHSDTAARAALDLRTSMKTLNQECKSRWNQELQIGAGLSSGEVVAGIYGSKEDFFLSGVGPEADFSRRLSKANRRYGSDLLVGPKTYQLISDTFEVRPMEMFYDPETDSLQEIYQLLSLKENFTDDARQLRDHFWDGVISFRAGNYREAIDSFSKARVPGKTDQPLECFIIKSQEKLTEESTGVAQQVPGASHSQLLEKL